MFKYIRVQILFPCRARCQWCSTHRKNPLFKDLHKRGVSDIVHDFYVDIIRHFKPREVFISGGEPLIYPRIAEFLNAIAPSVEMINVFTSYQYSQTSRERIPFDRMPHDKLRLNHTPIYFERDRWHKLTRGFPFDTYIANVQQVAKLPMQKRFKFIINHSLFEDEIQRFQELVEPNDTCEVSLKVMNDQGNGMVIDTMKRGGDRVRDRLDEMDALLKRSGWGHVGRPRSSADAMIPVLNEGVHACEFRKDPVELRFALHKANEDRQVLKYRFCPYFPADFHHKYHIGKDTPASIVKAYMSRAYYDHCHKCRFLNYRPGTQATTTDASAAANNSSPAVEAAP